MSTALEVITVVSCDSDDCSNERHGPYRSESGARIAARSDGWALVQHKDYCPVHAQGLR